MSILGSCSAGLRPGDSAQAKDTKYTELIMKCLWKLAKTIQENLRTNFLNADELLFEINRFFISTPPTEWKRRANEGVPLGEMPLRTVKTLLLELVNGLGDNIFQHLTLIEDPQRSSVYPYLHHMLEACRKKDRIQHQQQQQQPQQHAQQRSPMLSTQSMQQQHQQTEEAPNRFISHSRNSSLGGPASVSSLKSNTMMRSPSIASYPSADGETHNNSMENMSANQSPQLLSLSLNSNSNVQVQPMQIDEPPQSTPQSSQDNNNNGPHLLSDYESNNTLTRIFDKIGTRDQTKQVK